MEDNKKILLSGRLTGTRTFTSELEQLENRDNIENFLLFFSKLKINSSNFNYSDIKYINDDQELLEICETIAKSNYISIYANSNFSRLYIKLDSNETYIIRLNKVSPAIIGTFISKEKPIKYAINSFNFIKWCNSNIIDIKNLFDIPTYIKLLTNDVDPFKTAESYLKQYTDYELDESDNEKNNIAICCFINEFGKILSKYIEDFDLSTVSKLINENSYFEGNTFNNTGNCTIKIKLNNVSEAISSITENIKNDFSYKSYIISPLNRIAPKFRHDIDSLITDLYSEDLSITLLNELYNNNIPVQLNYETNEYIITCKFKNFNNIITLINAIFSETFFTLFDLAPNMHIECDIKE
ncbi:MAG: hypothetical protein J6C46_10770 [Clostridia bacterium]|nr:hypothetical protein [Clostridia bacterium]